MFQNVSKFAPFHFILIHLEKEGMVRKIGDEELERDYFFIEFEDYTALNYICLKSQLIIILVSGVSF